MEWAFFLSFKLLRHRHGLPVIAAQSVWKRNNLVVRPPTDLIGKESSLVFFSHPPSSLIRPAAILKSSGLAKQSRSRWWYRRNYFVDHDFFSRKCISAKRRRVVFLGGWGVGWFTEENVVVFSDSWMWLGEMGGSARIHYLSHFTVEAAFPRLSCCHFSPSASHRTTLRNSPTKWCTALHFTVSFIQSCLGGQVCWIYSSRKIYFFFFWIRKEKWGSCLTECNAGSFQPDSLRSSESHHQSNSLK